MSSFLNQIKFNDNHYVLKINLEKFNYFPGEIINVKIEVISNDFINFTYNDLRIFYCIKQIEYWQNNMNIKESSNQTPNGNIINEFSQF